MNPATASIRHWRTWLTACAALLAATGVGVARAAALAPVVISIPAGPFIAGSDAAEREYAYRIDAAAYGRPVTREQGWYENEHPRSPAETGAYSITVTPVTNRQYAAFVQATGRAVPDVDRATWALYGLIHPYARTRRFAWEKGKPPRGREHHPVVLVSQADELEWEKATRGTDGRYFPWGNEFDPKRLNSRDAGPFDTTPVGSYPSGESPFGLLDAAGQVFEWTATADGAGRAIVKGGSWDDKGCGVCRPAARHSRPVNLRHILIGFRLVRE